VARDSGSDDGEAEHVEHPDVGGTDWLLEQLGGGRESHTADASPDAADKSGDQSDAPAPGARDGVPAAEPDAAPPTTASPKLRWSWETGTVEPITVEPAAVEPITVEPGAVEPITVEPGAVEPADQPPALPEQAAGTVPNAQTPSPARQRADLPVAPGNAEPEPAEPATFNWALTPTDDVDPLVARPAPPPAPPAPASPASPASPGANGSDVADENVYFHPALPIPGAEPDVQPETTEIPAAAETTEIPAVAADTTQVPVAPGAPIDSAAPTFSERPAAPTAAVIPDAPTAAVIPAEPTEPLAAALERQRASRSQRRRAAATAAESVASPAVASAGGRRSAPNAASSSGHSGGASKRTTRILFWVAGALLVVLVLIGLYVFGMQIPGFVSAAPTPTPTQTATKTATPTASPTPTAQATGPQAPGVHAWDTLRGGECLNPFSSPWALKFTVVDCATPHAAQLVYTNVFTSDPAAVFPGDAQLASQINLLCTKPGIINLDAAGAFTDAQIQGSYPATEKQWKDGQRSYFCFVNRASGEPLTGSIAGTGPAA
jgi:hypothetical protein